jgi:hypothetical protein
MRESNHIKNALRPLAVLVAGPISMVAAIDRTVVNGTTGKPE